MARSDFLEPGGVSSILARNAADHEHFARAGTSNNTALIDALRFYANGNNYFDGNGAKRVNPNRSSKIDTDAGERARVALTKIGAL